MQDTEAKKKEIKRRFQLWIRHPPWSWRTLSIKKTTATVRASSLKRLSFFMRDIFPQRTTKSISQYRHIHTEKHCGGERSPGRTG